MEAVDFHYGGKFQFFAHSSIEAAFPDGQGVLPTLSGQLAI
jgi:hypothetical protein